MKTMYDNSTCSSWQRQVGNSLRLPFINGCKTPDRGQVGGQVGGRDENNN
jgi:hypothetical protein